MGDKMFGNIDVHQTVGCDSPPPHLMNGVKHETM